MFNKNTTKKKGARPGNVFILIIDIIQLVYGGRGVPFGNIQGGGYTFQYIYIYVRTLHGCNEPNGEPVWTAIHIRHAKICT